MTNEDFVTTCYGSNFAWKSHYTPKQELSVGWGGGGVQKVSLINHDDMSSYDARDSWHV